MKNSIVALILIATVSACDQNCFLGQNLFSAPLDNNNCCLDHLKGNCDNFTQLNSTGFVCIRCKVGFKFDNNNCVEYDHDEVCINPEITTIPFFPCKVCRISENLTLIPIHTKASQDKYQCVDITKTKHASEADKLSNCHASTNVKGKIYCYECEDNFYLDMKSNKCKPIGGATSKLVGCLIASDSVHCMVCHSEYQLDFTKSLCVSRQTKIDIKGYEQKMKKKMQMMMIQMQAMRQQQSAQGQMGGQMNMGGGYMGIL